MKYFLYFLLFNILSILSIETSELDLLPNLGFSVRLHHSSPKIEKDQSIVENSPSIINFANNNILNEQPLPSSVENRSSIANFANNNILNEQPLLTDSCCMKGIKKTIPISTFFLAGIPYLEISSAVPQVLRQASSFFSVCSYLTIGTSRCWVVQNLLKNCEPLTQPEREFYSSGTFHRIINKICSTGLGLFTAIPTAYAVYKSNPNIGLALLQFSGDTVVSTFSLIELSDWIQPKCKKIINIEYQQIKPLANKLSKIIKTLIPYYLDTHSCEELIENLHAFAENSSNLTFAENFSYLTEDNFVMAVLKLANDTTLSETYRLKNKKRQALATVSALVNAGSNVAKNYVLTAAAVEALWGDPILAGVFSIISTLANFSLDIYSTYSTIYEFGVSFPSKWQCLDLCKVSTVWSFSLLLSFSYALLNASVVYKALLNSTIENVAFPLSIMSFFSTLFFENYALNSIYTNLFEETYENIFNRNLSYSSLNQGRRKKEIKYKFNRLCLMLDDYISHNTQQFFRNLKPNIIDKLNAFVGV